jgi:hypothetical protein
LIDERSAVRQRIKHMMVDCVIVPVCDAAAEWPVEFGGDNLHACFDQPSCEQALLAPLVSPVAISNGIRFVTKGLRENNFYKYVYRGESV